MKAPQKLYQLKGETVIEWNHTSSVNSKNQDVQEKYAIYTTKSHKSLTIPLSDIGTKYHENQVDVYEQLVRELEGRISLAEEQIDALNASKKENPANVHKMPEKSTSSEETIASDIEDIAQIEPVKNPVDNGPLSDDIDAVAEETSTEQDIDEVIDEIIPKKDEQAIF